MNELFVCDFITILTSNRTLRSINQMFLVVAPVIYHTDHDRFNMQL